MPRALIALLVAIFCSLALPSRAFAQRVLLLEPPPGDRAMEEAFNRLRAELSLQDFEVQVQVGDARKLSPDELEEAAQRADAFAAIALNRRGGSADADVSIVDRVTGKISLRRLAISAGPDSPRILAVRAVDLLRASLRELPPDERPPPDVVGVSAAPAPRELRAFTKQGRFWVSAAAAALSGAHDVTNGYGPSLAFWLRVTSRLQLGAFLGGPLVGARYRSSNGDAVVRQELGQLRAMFNVLEPGRFELGPVLGAGVYHLQAQGDVQAPYSSQSATLWSFAGSGGVEARLGLSEALWLTGSAQALLLTPRPVVAVDNASAELGQPLLLAAVGLGVSF
jgi:hypothetical protein